MRPLLLPLALLAGAGASAEARQFKDKDVVVVQPGKAYVVIRSGYASGIELLRKTDDSDRAAWATTRRNIYEKALKKYQRELRNYESDITAWNSGDRQERQMIGKKPTRPDEVTLEATPMAPIEMGNFVTIGRKPAVAEDASGIRTFIVEVTPGDYYIYGAPGAAAAIGSGACFCMGTVGFAVRAGQVVDAGTVTPTSSDLFAPGIYAPPPASSAGLPQLSGRTPEPARMTAVGKMANFKASPITRVSAVAGVLAYDRDVPLDAANGNQPLTGVR